MNENEGNRVLWETEPRVATVTCEPLFRGSFTVRSTMELECDDRNVGKDAFLSTIHVTVDGKEAVLTQIVVPFPQASDPLLLWRWKRVLETAARFTVNAFATGEAFIALSTLSPGWCIPSQRDEALEKAGPYRSDVEAALASMPTAEEMASYLRFLDDEGYPSSSEGLTVEAAAGRFDLTPALVDMGVETVASYLSRMEERGKLLAPLRDRLSRMARALGLREECVDLLETSVAFLAGRDVVDEDTLVAYAAWEVLFDRARTDGDLADPDLDQETRDDMCRNIVRDAVGFALEWAEGPASDLTRWKLEGLLGDMDEEDEFDEMVS